MTETDTQNNQADTPVQSESLLSPRKRVKAQIERLEQSVAELKAEVEAEKDKRLRLLAEYDNFRRRTQSEYRNITLLAGERIITKLLPVMDDLDRLVTYQVERASRPLSDGSRPLHGASKETDETSVLPAIELIRKKLGGLLEGEGLTPIDAAGVAFDAELHEAISEMVVPGIAPGAIVAEAEKGYKLGEKVIRHSKVVVAKGEEE